MAIVTRLSKACTVNPLKMSQTIGAALAFLGLDRCMPLLHGAQGCTAFGLVLFVRHFREAIPLQTTAMSEVTTIMGGMDNVEQAILNIYNRAHPAVIGICSTGLAETQGEDVEGFLRIIRARHPELAAVALVFVSTPDYEGAFQDGWSQAVTRMVEELAEPAGHRQPQRINILPGSHLTPGDIEELRETAEAFGFDAQVIPDLSGSLDGHVPEDFCPTTHGGASLSAIRGCGTATFTLAVGEQMRAPAEALKRKTGVPYHLFPRLTGLAAADDLIELLSERSGRPVPAKYRRQRSQLVDAMLDGHFAFAGKQVAIAAEPDLLAAVAPWFAEMGAKIAAAVTTTESPVLAALPTDEVLIGDLADLESRAGRCDLLVTHAHGRQMAARLGRPLLRMGLPLFDRLGGAHRTIIGYRGTRDLVFEAGNMLSAQTEEQHASRGDEHRKLQEAVSFSDAAGSGGQCL
ncbi:MAG: nitrogenase iron-molybdenum cofactor biosynthesis protein NifN [Gammaproteobacteria bacterium]|nr:nitrogenase iron-molybdenum cofactor biosynthesis protein NifN [Gammaproteobacteria bacterium]